MKARRWFLPETPDVLRLLRDQVAITIEGMDAFARWADGDPEAAVVVAEAERRGDTAKRELLVALRAAFVLPLEPEDLFALSRGVDRILSSAQEVVAESALLACPPDPELVEMARLLGGAVRHIDDAVAGLAGDGDAATVAADAAMAQQKALADAYQRGMAALLQVDERGARIAGRELYRRCMRIGDFVVDVAERIIYAVVKQS
jgi:uncharacterized protein Yka (UPF0111/DUF47 family)